MAVARRWRRAAPAEHDDVKHIRIDAMDTTSVISPRDRTLAATD